MQPQLLFDQLERQFDVPAPHIQARDLMQWQLLGVEYVGQLLVLARADAKLDPAHGVRRAAAR